MDELVRAPQALLGVVFSALLVCTTLAQAQTTQGTPRAHPYLYFTADELPALRERLKREPFATKWKQFLAAADSYQRSDVLRQANPRTELGIIGTNSFAYIITAEAKYGQRAKAEMMALLKRGPWHTDMGWNKGVDLNTAESCVAAALFYDWCYDLMTDAERSEFRQLLLERGIRVHLRSIEQYRDWWVANLVSNWAGVCHGGAGLASLAIYDEEPEARKAADLARRYVTRFLKAASHEDGAGDEGVMYWRYGTEFGHYLAWAARRFYGDDGGLYAQTAEKLTGYWDAYMLGPDGRYANFNDMDEVTFAQGRAGEPPGIESGTSAHLAALFEAEVPGGDKLLLWAADNGHSAAYWRGLSPFYFMWRRPDAPPAGEKPPLQNAALFRGAGHAIFQSPSLWLAFNGGWISDRSHHNYDLGTFVLVANGERFVHDPGYGRTATGEHSTILVKGGGQPRGGLAQYTAFGSGPGFHYLASDLSRCYFEPLERFTRHMIMVDGRYVVMLDDLALLSPDAAPLLAPALAPALPAPAAVRTDRDRDEPPLLEPTPSRTGPTTAVAADPAAGESNFQWRLQTRRTVEVASDGASAVLRGRGQMRIIPLLPADADLATGTLQGGRARATTTPSTRRVRSSHQPVTFVSITPDEARRQEAILVVLYPAADVSTALPEASVKRDGDTATLSVLNPDGRADRIVFAIDPAGKWRLQSVNGSSAEMIGPPRGRILVPFRDN